MKNLFKLIFLAVPFILVGCNHKNSDYPNSDYGKYLECLDKNLFNHTKSIPNLSRLRNTVDNYCLSKWQKKGVSEIASGALLKKSGFSNDLKLTVMLDSENSYIATEKILSNLRVNVRLNVPLFLSKDGMCEESPTGINSKKILLTGWSENLLRDKNDLTEIEINLSEVGGKKFSDYILQEENKCIKNWYDNLKSDYIEKGFWTWSSLSEYYLDMSIKWYLFW